MQKAIYIHQVGLYADFIDQSVIDYIASGQIETYESFKSYDILAFDWYDLRDIESKPAQLLIYLDKDDLFYICENELSFEVVKRYFASDPSNERALYLFFRNLFKSDAKQMEAIEQSITALDEDVSAGTEEGLYERLMDIRTAVLRAKKYCEQLEFMMEEICDDEERKLSEDGVRYFEILHSRSVRLLSQAKNLRDYITQVRESYQAQIGIEQNQMMKVFTMVTSIFLPLTLIAGWYGMNVQMPETRWPHGYAFVAGLCVLVSIVWYIVFKRMKWFK